jgi:DNA ligase-1
MDGVRAYWDGQRLFSRAGRPISVPSTFIHGLPPTQLDGELWMGRGMFDILMNTLSNTNEWKDVIYWIIDLPSSKEPYESRLNTLRQLNLPMQARIITVEQCKGTGHLETYLDSILAAGGEGIMARRQASLYTCGRTSSVLKVKVMI